MIAQHLTLVPMVKKNRFRCSILVKPDGDKAKPDGDRARLAALFDAVDKLRNKHIRG